jgi:hypothetical protein
MSLKDKYRNTLHPGLRRHRFFSHLCWPLFALLLLFLSSCGTPTPSNNPGSSSYQVPPQQNTPSTAGPQSFYHQKGVTWQIDQTWGEWPNTNWKAVEQDAADIHNAGITWARVSFSQDPPFAYFDRIVQIAKAYNIQLLPIIYKNNPSNDLGNPDQQNQYKQWLASSVQHFKGYVHYWEIGNEENLSDNWNIDTDPNSNQAEYDSSVQRYVQLLQESYEVIHANDPNGHVVAGGLSEYRAERYLDSMIKFDAYKYMDIMAFHPYSTSPAADLDRFKMLQSKMASQPGFAQKPIWVTEIGFHTQANWTNIDYVPTEQGKAAYLVEVMNLLSENGAQLSFWYTLHESDDVNGHGLTVRNPSTLSTTYLPAYQAYKQLWN